MFLSVELLLKEPFLIKVQFVAIIIRILDVIKYGHFL